MKTVLVTGAAGTVGGYAAALAEAAGHRVVANDVRGTAVRVPARGRVAEADIRDPDALPGLVEGCDTVIHTAAQLDPDADPAELTHTNADAVVNLYEAAHRAGVRRFVHMSSATLYAGSPEPRTEEAALAPRGSYGMSKHAAEVFLRGRNDGPAWTILRAAPIYGRRGRHFAASLLAVGPVLRLTTPVLPRPSGGPQATMVHAEDVARALLFTAERDETAYRVLNVADGDVIPLGDRVALAFDAYGLRSIPTGKFPRPVLDLAGEALYQPAVHRALDSLLVRAWRVVMRRYDLKPALRPRLDPEALALLHEDLIVDASALRDLGWAPRYPRFADGWRQVLRWYQAEGWVPRYA